ncbi:ribonucleotide reductase subunit alpha [Alishewanella longhuensis]
MNIESYTDLIHAAKLQSEPQRLLFVFAKAELPNGYTDTQKHNFEQGQGGALAPVLCVAKLPDEVADFSTLVVESSSTGIDWDIAFVSALGGRGGFAPNNDEATQPLKMMTEKIQGGMIADFLTFDKAGELVALSG